MTRATGRHATASRRAQLVALVCVAAQLAVATHLVLVRHAACPEHGDLLHGDPGHGLRAMAQPPARTAALRVAAPAEDAHEHDHCSVPSERRKQAPAAAGYVLGGAESGPEVCVPASIRAQPGVELFRLAPKQSPPAV